MSMKYNPVTKQIADELAAIVGEKYVIYGDDHELEQYSHDEIPDRSYARMPEVVIRPKTSEEIAAIMKLANRELIPVTPRGAGSGLSGGAVPVYGGIVLLVDRMNSIVEFDNDNMMITVEPGMVTNEINEFLEEFDLFFAGYPMSGETCYIGGNVAENAGGGKAVKYGITGRYVIGLEIVTPAGKIVQLGGKLLKDVAGYNLIGLITGSEGTLAVITKVTLKLMPLPKHQVDLLCLFKTSEEAIQTVPKIMTECGVIPTAIEFMDRNAVRAACEYLNESIAYQDAGAMLIITVDGSMAEQVEAEYEMIGELCQKYDAIEVYVADNPTTTERIWKIRRNIGEAYNIISRRQSNEDISVPPADIPKMVEILARLSEKYHVMIPCFGHAGDGNLHARIVSDPKWSDEKWRETLPQLLDELYAETTWLGGTISGEHGIGHKRKGYLEKVADQNYLDMLRSIKGAFDPNNILNPGKIFDMKIEE